MSKARSPFHRRSFLAGYFLTSNRVLGLVGFAIFAAIGIPSAAAADGLLMIQMVTPPPYYSPGGRPGCAELLYRLAPDSDQRCALVSCTHRQVERNAFVAGDDFVLHQYLQTELYDEPMIRYFRRVNDEFAPGIVGQFNAFEVRKLERREDFRAVGESGFPQILIEREGAFYEAHLVTSERLTRGYSVSIARDAQGNFGPVVRSQSLPITEQYRSLDLKKIVGSGVKYFYEGGRAANVSDPTLFTALLKLLVASAASEVRLYGGRLEEAAIVLHVHDPVARESITRFPAVRHKEKFGFVAYPQFLDGERKDALLYLTLDRAVKLFHLEIP